MQMNPYMMPQMGQMGFNPMMQSPLMGQFQMPGIQGMASPFGMSAATMSPYASVGAGGYGSLMDGMPPPYSPYGGNSMYGANRKYGRRNSSIYGGTAGYGNAGYAYDDYHQSCCCVVS
jgi:hypothetical protein